MRIDYKKEVDSGFDRKRIVEQNIIALLNAGIPTDIISKSKEFNFRHHEMLNNLTKGYESKEEQVLEIYGNYSTELDETVVGHEYSGVAHPVGGELYPPTPQEEIELFKKLKDYNLLIESQKQKETTRLQKEQEQALKAITRFRTKNPIIDRIISLSEELDQLFQQDQTIDNKKITALFKKYNLNPKNYQKYNERYAEYNRLLAELNNAASNYEQAKKGIVTPSEILKTITKKKRIEEEIIKRNTKLVNGFIRQKYGNLLVETEDLFQICYIAMAEAVKEFDLSRNNKFSSLAYEYMDRAVKSNFKELTGYKWNYYWTKKKIEILLENTSKMLGEQVTVYDLVNYGLLDLSETRAVGIYSMITVYPKSQLLSKDSLEVYERYLEDTTYQEYFGDDEILDFDDGIEEESIEEDDVFVDANNSVISDDIESVLDTLTPKEKQVLIMLYGLFGERTHTLEETGNLFGVTRERIRQIEAKALRKLRHPSRAQKLRGHV